MKQNSYNNRNFENMPLRRTTALIEVTMNRCSSYQDQLFSGQSLISRSGKSFQHTIGFSLFLIWLSENGLDKG